MKSVGIIVPIFNEQETIPYFLEEFLKISQNWEFPFSLTFVDDGSSDKSVKTLEEFLAKTKLEWKIVSLSRNFGKEAALFAGIRLSTEESIIPMDIDLQDPLEVVPVLVKSWQEGSQVVLAKRNSRNEDSFSKRNSANYFYRILSRFSGYHIESQVGDFRLLSRKVIDSYLALGESNRFNKGLFSYPGYTTSVVEYERPRRVAGVTRQPKRKLLKLALDGLFANTGAPLSLIVFLAGATSFFAIGWIVFIILARLVGAISIPGYASTVSLTLLVGSVNLIAIAIVGEYVRRINLEVKNRPQYFIDWIKNSDAS